MVEFDAIGPVPLAAMMLADMGASVVRITRPRRDGEAWDNVGGAILHRSRPAVELDLKTDVEQALALIAAADAVIEGFRPGVMERLGLGPDPCLARNPRLVYGRITGWGQTGPLSQRAGHDINYIGLSGALNAMGAADRPPPVPLNLIGDYGGGTMLLVTGVLAALLSGKGQVVDAAMVDGIATMTAMFQAFRATGAWRDARADNLLDGAAPFYRCYRCADDRYVAVGALEPKFFQLLLSGLGLSADALDQHNRAEWPAMADRFASLFAQRTRDEWTAVFADGDACVTPVLDWAEAARHPHHQSRRTYISHDRIDQPAPAPRFSATPGSIGPATRTTVDATLAHWASLQR